MAKLERAAEDRVVDATEHVGLYCLYVERRGGLFDGDVLVVDRSVEPKPGTVVIAVLDGEMTVKTLAKRGSRYSLVAEAHEMADFPEIVVGPDQELRVWGVVVGVARSMLP